MLTTLGRVTRNTGSHKNCSWAPHKSQVPNLMVYGNLSPPTGDPQAQVSDKKRADRKLYRRYAQKER